MVTSTLGVALQGPCLTLVAVLPLVASGTLFPALSGDVVTRHFWRAATFRLAAIPVIAGVTVC